MEVMFEHTKKKQKNLNRIEKKHTCCVIIDCFWDESPYFWRRHMSNRKSDGEVMEVMFETFKKVNIFWFHHYFSCENNTKNMKSNVLFRLFEQSKKVMAKL